MKRRDLLIGSGALAGGSLLPDLRQSALAQAKPSQMVIMTWGGLWGDAMRDGAGNAFEKETGIKIVQDRSGSPADRITKTTSPIRSSTSCSSMTGSSPLRPSKGCSSR
jgi:putative spermidine/putrescine transport system substrate-binding protein